MDAETLRLAVIVALACTAGVWLLSTFVWRVSGTWDRELTDDERAEGAHKERITLAQLGPFVTGRRDVRGGYQEYSGLMVGKRLTLNRRDHGKKALSALGFPDAIAEKLDGEIMARLRLRLVDGGFALEGTFEPQKVEFTHQPPRVTTTYFLPGQPRRYRRTVAVHDRVPALDEADVRTGAPR